MAGPTVRVEDAGLGVDAQVRLVVSGVSDLGRLQRTWASSGAALERAGPRLRATTSVPALARAAGRSLPGDEAAGLDRALHDAVAAWAGDAPPVPLPDGRVLAVDRRPLVMGVVNVTDDSFSDGGRLYPDGHPQAGIAHGRQLARQGADILDVGGESTRPGAAPVGPGEERRRVLPVVEALAADGCVVSVDTRKASVARPALAAGARVVNDVSGAADPELLEAVAAAGAAYVLMHTRGTPEDMQRRTDYGDVVAEVYEFLAEGLDRCAAAGVDTSRVLVDPGIGFAKTAEQSLALLRALRQFRGLGRPVLLGVSRKSFLGPLAVLRGEAAAGAGAGGAGAGGPDQRLEGSLACAALAVADGVAVLRVHDVPPTIRVARAARAVRTGHTGWEVLG